MSERYERINNLSEAWTLRSTTIDDPAWVSLLCNQTASGLQDAAWAGVVCDGLGFVPSVLILENCGNAVAGAVGFRRKIAGAQLMYIGYPYGTFIGNIPDGDIFYRLVLQWAERNGVHRVRIPTAPASCVRAFSGFKTIPMKTQVIDLSGATRSSLWAGLSTSTRRNVRRAERDGVEVIEASTPGEVDAFFGLYLQAMARNKALAKIRKSFVHKAWSMQAPGLTCKILLARLGRDAIAGLLLMDTEEGSYYLMGGSRSDMLEHRPNDLIFWKAIERSLDRGSTWFDFLPSGGAGQELIRFKAKWGAKPVSADVLQLDVSPKRMMVWDWVYRLSKISLARQFIEIGRKR